MEKVKGESIVCSVWHGRMEHRYRCIVSTCWRGTGSGTGSGSCLTLHTDFNSSAGGPKPGCNHEPKIKSRASLKQTSQTYRQGAQTPSSLQYAIKRDPNIPHSSGELPYKRTRTLFRSNGTSSTPFAMRMTSFRRLCARPSS